MDRDYLLFIFGGTGDLARRKLYPGLQNLYKSGRVKGLKRTYALGREEGKLSETLKELDRDFAKLIEFVPFDVKEREEYKKISKEVGSSPGTEVIIYLALPPQLFETAIVHTGAVLKKFPNPRKIVIEKPFGFDLESAKRLNFQLKRYFTEREIYRIDHFLGKVPIQNILSVRFSNYIFEGIWNKNFIDNIQISATETLGLEGRASYYDRVGALRDMVQNHLMQILCFLAMEPPAVMDAERIRDEKVKVLASIRKFDKGEVDGFAVRGQYSGYTHELGRDSNTETFAVVKLFIENFRWEGVPFYLRTGKKLKEKKTEAVIVFKEVPGNFGRLLGCTPDRNKLAFEIAPGTRVVFRFQMMPPTGLLACPMESSMEIDLAKHFGQSPPEAYEALLGDIFEGDQTLFIREDESELSWEIIQPIIDRWSEDPDIPLYKPGTWGPREAREFMEKDGRKWVVV